MQYVMAKIEGYMLSLNLSATTAQNDVDRTDISKIMADMMVSVPGKNGEPISMKLGKQYLCKNDNGELSDYLGAILGPDFPKYCEESFWNKVNQTIAGFGKVNLNFLNMMVKLTFGPESKGLEKVSV